MSHKILIGIALVAVLVLGFAWISANYTATVLTQSPAVTVSSSTGQTVSTGTSSTSVSTTPVQTSFTLAEVATHNGASSCWSAINGNVYDLTSWINQHPGGPSHILNICGTDGSAAFNAQHAGQSRPASELANFYIGTLAE